MPLPLVCTLSTGFPPALSSLIFFSLLTSYHLKLTAFRADRTMLSLSPGRDSLRILWGPNNMHQLSGAVTTPLFRHLGLSSWHSVDGAIVHMFKFGPGGRLLMGGLRPVAVAAGVGLLGGP